MNLIYVNRLILLLFVSMTVGCSSLSETRSSQTSQTSQALKGISVYPVFYVRHFELQPKTNDGNLNGLTLMKLYKRKKWNFDIGGMTFVDTYSQRAFGLGSDISHDDYQYGLFRPVLNLHCAYKGYSYSKDKRKLQCFPMFKLRIGKAKGLVANIIPIPKLGDVTNGMIGFEVGYRF